MCFRRWRNPIWLISVRKNKLNTVLDLTVIKLKKMFRICRDASC